MHHYFLLYGKWIQGRRIQALLHLKAVNTPRPAALSCALLRLGLRTTQQGQSIRAALPALRNWAELGISLEAEIDTPKTSVVTSKEQRFAHSICRRWVIARSGQRVRRWRFRPSAAYTEPAE